MEEARLRCEDAAEAAAEPAEAAAEETSVRAAPAAPVASADAIAELVVAKLAQRQQAPPTKVATYAATAAMRAPSPQHRAAPQRPPTALPPIVVSAPPTPTPAEAALEQMYVALPFHQRRA